MAQSGLYLPDTMPDARLDVEGENDKYRFVADPLLGSLIHSGQ